MRTSGQLVVRSYSYIACICEGASTQNNLCPVHDIVIQAYASCTGFHVGAASSQVMRHTHLLSIRRLNPPCNNGEFYITHYHAHFAMWCIHFLLLCHYYKCMCLITRYNIIMMFGNPVPNRQIKSTTIKVFGMEIFWLNRRI